ncbi:hypothetical protein HanXRQr2_Chr10g0461071 [Helianthus annuus]|uniref:Uncharacterized protein n=1 Tax=Helianthus annuus TaxID=4232 RepID=A0A9K3I1F2_HELAN|nr:hypothetical protein HanXRQr2_Chr10g0461071 [Helianthus annuus]
MFCLQYSFQVSSFIPKLKKSDISMPCSLHGFSSKPSMSTSNIVLRDNRKINRKTHCRSIKNESSIH